MVNIVRRLSCAKNRDNASYHDRGYGQQRSFLKLCTKCSDCTATEKCIVKSKLDEKLFN